MQITETQSAQHSALLGLHAKAFGDVEGPVVAALVAELFEDVTARPILSLSATKGGEIWGHILFTRVKIEGDHRGVEARILAPLAVMPSRQGQGIGTRLVKHGLKALEASGVGLVMVLGHPSFYPRCGFRPATERELEAPYPIPPEHADAWMVAELKPGLLGHVRGVVRCCDALNRPEHW